MLHRIWAPYRRPPNLGCGGSLAVLSSCSSSWGAPCLRLRPDRRYAGVCAMRTARFPISCGMFSIAVLDLQERLLRRRSGGVNVSRVVSGIRCHRSGLLWRLCRHLSWFHNVRVLACIGRPYSGERCCSSAITRERNSLVRHDSLLREKLGVRTAPQLSRAGDQGPPALAPANNGVIRRFAAIIVPRRAIVLVARRIGFLLHSV